MKLWTVQSWLANKISEELTPPGVTVFHISRRPSSPADVGSLATDYPSVGIAFINTDTRGPLLQGGGQSETAHFHIFVFVRSTQPSSLALADARMQMEMIADRIARIGGPGTELVETDGTSYTIYYKGESFVDFYEPAILIHRIELDVETYTLN
ncbi:MAG: hypothetical protein V2G41_09315 [bacterium JZ-2024 1]